VLPRREPLLLLLLLLEVLLLHLCQFHFNF